MAKAENKTINSNKVLIHFSLTATGSNYKWMDSDSKICYLISKGIYAKADRGEIDELVFEDTEKTFTFTNKETQEEVTFATWKPESFRDEVQEITRKASIAVANRQLAEANLA